MPSRARFPRRAPLVFVSMTLAAALLSPLLRAQDDIKDAIDRGSRWLASQQNGDGGYGPAGEESRIRGTSDVGLTGIVLYALAKNPRGYKAADGPYISKAVDFLLARQQADGGIYDPKDPTLQNYKTSVALLALITLDRVRYADAIKKAQAFVKDQQFTDADGYEEAKHVSYGGFGYGGGLRPDMSNLNLALEALAESGLSGSDEVWRVAVPYMTRSQNSEIVDPVLKGLGIGTTGDGGFRYAPNETRGPTETLDDGTRLFSSYGSMTYAGLKSLLYARVDKNDPRVQQAFAWISRNWTVRENPGMASKLNPRAGLDGLYYYYHTMAKALSLYGEPVIKDAKGVEHHWAKELSDHLVSLQAKEGYWKNTSERWWENIAALDTSFAIIALVECQKALEREKQAGAKKPDAAAAPAAVPSQSPVPGPSPSAAPAAKGAEKKSP